MDEFGDQSETGSRSFVEFHMALTRPVKIASFPPDRLSPGLMFFRRFGTELLARGRRGQNGSNENERLFSSGMTATAEARIC
jgi:hypothetical protein